MAHVEWWIKGREFANCNCSYGCPCQFNALPTHGHCRAAVGWQIDQGVYGTVKLDALSAAGLYAWPGPCTRAMVRCTWSSTSARGPSSGRRSSRS